MKRKINIHVFVFLICAIVVIFGVMMFTRLTLTPAKSAYMVYLDGKKVGLIADKNALYDLIDQEQAIIKNSFKVDKVYPPDGLEAVLYNTYSNNIKSAEDIYKIISDKSNFTIKGYTITIKPDEGDPTYINILNKEDFEPALLDAVGAFVSTDGLNAYINDSQVIITETGKTIEKLYFDERITIKENFLSVDEMIIDNQSDLTKYLLFGTLDSQAEYIVKDGDTVENVAYNNKLSNEELLIANPNLASVNSILSAGQILNIGLINPLFTIVEESEVIEDISIPFETINEGDKSLYSYESFVKTQGKEGVSRVTEKVQYKNGEVTTLVVSGSPIVISAPVNKVVVRGTRNNGFNYKPPASSSTDYGWPTISPYIITSKFGYRWGRLHGAIDISGSGFGSPIYSSTDGVVVRVNKSCPDRGYLGNQCGGERGNYVEVKTSDGWTIIYEHMRSIIRVSEGSTVTKGQNIGYMGSSGSSTGTHLHFEMRDPNGVKVDPCKVAFSC